MTAVSTIKRRLFEYPTSDGKPMAETELHRDLMIDLIGTLQARFADDPKVHVSGNLLIYYEPGNKRKHVAPDVFVVRGIDKKERDYYLTWEEGKSPDVVIELTSSSTRLEDKGSKWALYRDVLKVKEYFLFDPRGDYLKPRFQGYSLRNGAYARIRSRQGRLPSRVLGLHLEPAGRELRFYDPATELWLPTPQERADRANQAEREQELEKQRANRAEREKELERQRADQADQRAAQAEREKELEKQRAEQADQRADEQQRVANEEKRRADELQLLLDKLLREKKNGR